MRRNLKHVATLHFFLFNFCLADPLIVAHRGSSQQAPENTLPAFRLAWQQGADAIEGDFLLTKDGKVVCIHDVSTKRLADKNLVVSKSNLKELRALDVGAWKNEIFKGTKIPTISEVFATVPKGKKIFVEIKGGLEIVSPLIAEIRRSRLSSDQVKLICFNEKVVKVFKQKMPDYQAYWLSGFKRDGEGIWKPSAKSVIATLKNIKADGLDSHCSIPNKISAAILDAGFEWHAWTINDVATAKKLAKRGISSITTDCPELLVQVFRK